ncbi:MAG: glycoside hydrolase family 3 N-terminal domain-containing protein, partial [Bacteroidota bacterium]
MPAKTSMKQHITITLLFLTFVLSYNKGYSQRKDPPFLNANAEHWVDSVFNSLNPHQRMGQLFMLGVQSNKNKKYEEEIADEICNFNIGGVMFLKGGPVRQANLTNYYQSLAQTPMMIAIDGEWGLAMRLDSTIRFPRQMTLGAMKDYSLIYKMGTEIARQCKRMGIHINFAPVADVNNNPLNPVISNRSFGEDKTEVATKSIIYMKALQDNGILATAKHFPGHGDATADSHLELPVINQTKEEMDSVELYPFKELISEGLGSIMVAHLNIPAYDTAKNMATTLSKNVVTHLLKEKLGFKGVVFTDALNMKGVSKFYKPGVVDVKALLAGNDVLLDAQDVAKAEVEITKALQKQEITQEEIDARVKKILTAKYWLGLNEYHPIEINNLVDDLNTIDAQMLDRRLFRSS